MKDNLPEEDKKILDYALKLGHDEDFVESCRKQATSQGGLSPRQREFLIKPRGSQPGKRKIRRGSPKCWRLMYNSGHFNVKKSRR